MAGGFVLQILGCWMYSEGGEESSLSVIRLSLICNDCSICGMHEGRAVCMCVHAGGRLHRETFIHLIFPISKSSLRSLL